MSQDSRSPQPAVDGSNPDETILHRFRDRVQHQGHRTSMRHRPLGTGSWETISWGAYGRAVHDIAAGLISRDVALGDSIAILASNRPSWHICDLGIMSAGAVSVPIYPTSSSSQVAYVLADSGARFCFVDDAEQLAKVVLHLNDLPDLERVIMMEPNSGFDRPGLVVTMDELCDVRDADRRAVEERVDTICTDDLASLVYTSGTTGPPKGARLTHGNIMWTIDSVDSLVHLAPTDRWLSYLPLSHIAERLTSHFGQIAAGGETWFAGSLATVPDDLQACRPTIFMAVPRVWQKLHDSIMSKAQHAPVSLDRLLDSAATSTPDPARPRWSPTSLIRNTAMFSFDHSLAPLIRRSIGLDRARLLVSSAAPIHPDLIRWFHGIGLPIAEVYGQTEDCGPATMNVPGAIKIGSVGRPIPGLEACVADDGELLFRGGSVCDGYHQLPDASAQLIDNDGWMHSGDIGVIDDDGFVWITGRKKDIIINAAGQNIAPAEIESRLTMEPLIGQAVVVGDGRRYLTGLLALDTDAATTWARDHGGFADMSNLAHDQRIRDEIAAAVERVNQCHAPVEQLKYWRLIPEPLTVESGELTPTMKVKRNVVSNRYADLIEAMYVESVGAANGR
ncbi:MAG: long-chain acyl-CoA synthetase [Ilumatobacter sp.]|jgi:long-chain acyl-CoA synthetase